MTKLGTKKPNNLGRCCLFAWLGFVGAIFGIEGSFVVFADSPSANQFSQIITNTGQFQRVFNESASVKYQFHLSGTVTMVDTNRNLFVLQDNNGAIAVNLNGGPISLQPGQCVLIQGDQASPYFEPFPNYPYQPSGWDIRNSFEAPSNSGEYHLTRMRGYLHPPFTGDYMFWIASDNSSELWLSVDDKPAMTKKIAFIKSGDWVNQHEWHRYPSQRSETIKLSADKTYYIEAISEQLLLDENLAVAWQPPGFRQQIIDGRYLTPWVEDQEQAALSATNGVLREYWTNYTVGNLAGVIDQKSFTPIFILKAAQVTVLGQGTWPEPQTILLDQPLLPEKNFHWVKVPGTIDFVGVNGNSAVLELAYNGRHAQVRVSGWKSDLPFRFQNRQVQVEGVCEGMQTENGYLMPGLIWTPTMEGISFIKSTNWDNNSVAINALDRFSEASNDTNHVWSGFVSIRGVVTFNDRVLGKDFLFIQNDAAGIYISQNNHHFNQLQVGQWVEVGGTLIPGGNTPNLNPVVVTMLGRRPIPKPVTQPVEIPVMASRNGQWTELEGVIHVINPDGTMLMVGKRGGVSVWGGQTSKDTINRHVDSTLRLRGVLLLETADNPKLLVPSPDFVEVEEEAPKDPFEILSCYTTEINDAAAQSKWVHRVKIEGVVTYNNEGSLFVQDAQGGLLVELLDQFSSAKVGDRVEVVGFPGNEIHSKKLTEALMRVVGSNAMIHPQKLNLTKASVTHYYGTLVSLEAKILTQKTIGHDQILSLQEGQRLFEALLSTNLGQMPTFEPDSRLKIVGVLDGRAHSEVEKIAEENDSYESVKVFMRGNQDIVLVRGAPWWTLKGFLLLSGTLLTVVVIGLSVIFILRRRLERQRLAKFIFSRQILQSQEDERRRIAVNLHDTLGQNLLIIKNQSRMAMQLPADEIVLRRRLNEISDITLQTIEEVRTITRNLRPYQLDRLGLTHAIRAVIKQTSENTTILFASDVDDIDGAFDKEYEIHVFRIIQEGINNIIKHSSATEATVVIKRNEAVISLSIRDNGKGFDVHLVKPVGFGLNNIVERVWILGGESKIDTVPGGGTNLLFQIPIPKPCNETQN